MTHTGIFSPGTLRPLFPEPESVPAHAAWVLVQGDSVLITPGDPPSVIMTGALQPRGITAEHTRYLGFLGAVPVYAAEIPAGRPPPDGLVNSGVRDLFGRIPQADLAIAALAVQLITFDRTSRFCGRCGAETRPLRTERSRLCTACNLMTYPRLSPAVVVLVQKEEEILLARSPRFPPGMFSLVAGFVEPGENLEETVVREVQEETGIAVRNVRYFGSEPWPFPNSLMAGFTADYAGGDIVIDPGEIEAAAWFGRNNLPRIPEKLSISRAIIDWWLDGGSPVDR